MFIRAAQSAGWHLRPGCQAPIIRRADAGPGVVELLSFL
jgi:hypothetical protein